MVETGRIAGRIARNTGMLFGGKLTAATIGLVVLVILGKSLAPDQFGGLLLLHAYAASFSGLASFNSWQMVLNYGVGPYGRGDWSGLHGLLRFAMALDGFGAAFAAGLAMAIMPFAYRLIGMPDGFFLPALGYCALTFFKQTSASTGYLRLADRFDLLGWQTLVMPVTRLAGVSACALLGATLDWYIAVWFVAAFLSYISLPLLALRELARRRRLAGLFSHGRWLTPAERGMWRFAFLSNLDTTAKTAGEHLPTLLAGALFGPAAAAIYRISRQIADLFARAVMQFGRALHPEIARLFERGEYRRILRLAVRSSLALLGLGLAAAGALALSGADLLAGLLDASYGGADGLVALLLVAATMTAAAIPFHPILYASRRPGRALLARLGGVGAFLALVPLIAQHLGVTSLGWAAIAGEWLALALVAVFAVRGLQGIAGQASASASRMAATVEGSDIPEARSGGPGQPVSGKSAPANWRGPE